jgi:hypothetical protein
LRIRYAAKIPSNGPSTPAAARSSIRLCTKRTDGGQVLAVASASIPAEPSTATISASGATDSSAAVDSPVPQPASSRRSPAPLRGNPIRCAEIRRCSS